MLVLGFDEGGFSPATWVWSVVPLAIAAGSLLAGQARRPSPLELGFLAALAGLLGWTLISTIWSLDPTASLLDAQRLLLYVSTAAALVLPARPGSRPSLLVGVLVAITVLCVAGLADAAVGDDPIGTATDDPGSEDRLAEPIGYANGIEADVYDVDANNRKAPDALGILSTTTRSSGTRAATASSASRARPATRPRASAWTSCSRSAST